MTAHQPQSKPEQYWEQAGEVSYAEAMFLSREVERHVNQRAWDCLTDTAFAIGIPAHGRVLDLGCGDGAFTNLHLSRFFEHVDGYDLSNAAVERANRVKGKPGFHFMQADITKLDYTSMQPYDGVFLTGILHHIKKDAAALVQSIRPVAPRVVVLEPNGSHPVRKLLERTELYRNMGEDSFRTHQIIRMFKQAGYEQRVFHRIGAFPNFTPLALFRLFKPFEALMETIPPLNWNCTTNIYGFVRREG